MIIRTTDGKEYYVPENCFYCQLNTAGQHSIDCPMSPKPKFTNDIRIFKYDDNGSFIKEIK